ncbi:rho GTPase-activating protein 18-like isoform X4 [Sinocyclocheilus rhinocerous]|uniref:rho GTPase-activating protein 18-like isoform X4 n=1 Tax=Sinocyclocheilus rhinocerous TaxID=307959 RepID=UPI0007B893BD|nr:PREDICTED: rho GTPase-activating protein 18-like isoform X4 [Sinocyclocheilus rhinocerous]
MAVGSHTHTHTHSRETQQRHTHACRDLRECVRDLMDDVKDCGGVILTAFHSFRIHADEQKHAADNRKAQYQRIGSMSLERDSMEDYWSEMKSIDEERQGGPEELMERASVDEAELEEAWLQEAGLSTLVTGTQSDGPAEALLSTLTRSQAAMVKKRLDNYTQTLRKRNRQPMRHVRDVFSMSDASSELTPPVSPNGQIAPKLPQWNPPKVPPSCAADTNGSSSASETILLSFDVPYSEAARAHRKGRECQDCRRIRKDDRDLPSYQIVRPRQGVTRVSDLSSEDIKKIGYISLIELTTFYDFMGIEMKRNRVVRSKARDSGIFGVPLTTLLENDQKKYPGSRVPLVFKKLLSKLEQTGLQTEGILRVPGSASRVKHLRQELELKFYEDRFDWDQVRQNDAAGLLKMFIRELPYPLLTQQHLPAFTAAQSISSPKHQIQALHLLIMLLPEANRDTLKVPCFLISHVRKMNEAAMGKKTPTSEKSKRRLLKRWNMEKERERSEVTDLRDGVIRVHAPLHAKVSMAIQLNAEMKASDITARFDIENGRGSRSGARRQRQYLFEIGGNIGERCLDPDAHLLDVYRVNPQCEWVLKSRLT